MKTRNLQRVALGLFAALALAGNGITHVHALTVFCPTNRTVECNVSWSFDEPTATNSCCITNSITPVTNTVSIGICGSTHTRVWLVADCCTNYTCSQTITVVDTTPPAFSDCPTNMTVECGTSWDFGTPSAYDTCCASNPTVTILSTTASFISSCQSNYTRIWQATDCCSNSVTCTQIVSVVDTVSPSFTVYPTNMELPCTGANGRTVDFTVTAVDNCATNIAVTCTPPSGSFFFAGETRAVNCRASDACGNETNYTFAITILTNCPSNSCITLTCPPDKRLPCEGVHDTMVNWTWDATNHCISTNLLTWSDPPPGTLFDLGTHTVTCYASNTLGGELRTCHFTVEIFPESPRLTARIGTGLLGPSRRLVLGWRVACGEFTLETLPGSGLGGADGKSDWSPITGLPSSSWTVPNPTNNLVDRIFGADFPWPEGDPAPGARFFRLTSDPSKRKDFSPDAAGPFTNSTAIPAPPVWMTFSRPGGGEMEIVGYNNAHALQVDDQGIVVNFPTNNAPWPGKLSGPPVFHEAELRVVGYINVPKPCWFAEAFDTDGQLVDAYMTTNATVTLRSRGIPLHHVKVFTEPNEPVGLMSIKGRTDYALAIDQLGCLDFTSYPTSTVVPNPWELPGHTIGSTNDLGLAEPSTYIEAGPDGYGNGYHVNYSTTIQLTTNCCRHIQVELIKHAGPVQVSAYDESGAELAAHVVTETGTPVTVDFPPSSAPICRVVVTSPDDQTRILRICCLPALQPIPPPTWCPGTNSNPLVTSCNSVVTGPVSFQLVSGGLLANQLYTYLLPHASFTVFDLGTESLATLATPCNKVVIEVFSENPNSGMELEAADQYGFVVARGGPLEPGAALQTVVLSGTGITTVRFKCPAAEGYLKAFHGLP